jgi:hypothetical protein
MELPCGGWVVFHDPEEVTGRHHRRVIAAMKFDVTAEDLSSGDAGAAQMVAQLGKSGKVMSMGMDYVYGMTCMLIAEWDIPYTPIGTGYIPHQLPLPCDDPGALESLRYKDYRAIIDMASPLVSQIEQLGGGPATPDDAGVPGSPTAPAGD